MIAKNKILVLTSSYPKYKGDVNGNFIYELSTRLQKDFEIHVLAPIYKGALKKEIRDGIIIHRHKQFIYNNVELAYGSDILAKIKKNFLFLFVIPFYLYYQFWAIKKIIKYEKINIIHAHWMIPQGFIAVLYKILFNKKTKIIVTIHGADINSFNNYLGKIIKQFILKRIDKLTVVSNALKQKVIKLGYLKEIYVYPMGVDTNLFSPEKKDISLKVKYNIKNEFLLFVGTLSERKGIKYLIQAMPLIIKEYPEAKLLVIGDGNLKNEMIALTKELKVDNNIIFTGAIEHDKLPPYFATADLFILPSLSEGFGLVIIEAISCKTLAVTSNLPEINDIIIENNTGFYFENKNSTSISQKIIYILKNKEIFNTIKENGRQYVNANFAWNLVSNNYIKIINSLYNN